ncbi:MAG: PEP-CTERM sorting domain-containing protein [bacterium]|nr:PEP-CTERM sorting domain-containing protein [bacterium]MDP3380896.1 PEP-CTERM sorting domain-containing protein [bacterium]
MFKNLFIAGIISLFMTLSAQAAFVPFQGTGNFELNGNTVSDVSLNNGMAFNNSSDLSFLGFGGFADFDLVVGENLHFWFTDVSSNLVNLFGTIAQLTTSDINLPGLSFSFFGVNSNTGEIFEASGSRTINDLGIVTSNSINVSGQFGNVPEPETLLLMGIGLLGFFFSRKSGMIKNDLAA